MQIRFFLVLIFYFVNSIVSAQPEPGFQTIFDGRTLEGWKAPDMSYWSIEDGAITAKITKEHPCSVNQYLVWHEPMDDFELKLKFRITGSPGTNSGFQFRSKLLPNGDMAGYQMDNNRDTPWLARLYEEHGRETLAFRGKKAVIGADGKSTLSDIPEAGGPTWFQLEEWHEYDLVCQGAHLLLKVNGRPVAEVIDGDQKRQALSGLLGLQLHDGPPMTVQFKDIRLKKLNCYQGKYCDGTGDMAWLKLIDESFAFFHANPDVPNLTMLYKADWDTFEEGAGWGAWWIQNGYGFSYASTPFLPEPWFSTLQRSWDLFWDNQGDGKRMGLWGGSPTAFAFSSLVAPDGCLGDTAAPGWIIYKQGDGDLKIHDWFYEATAAGVVMQAEILLANRDRRAMLHYIPKMQRACDAIENTRDPKNNLFLVGPACNLLAPSYGGVRQPDGSFGKGYLAGLSISYLAALDRMVELYKLTGDKEKLTEYEHRQRITRESLPHLLTPAGYFVKSIEPGGIKHGVLGQDKYAYLEGVANADALGLRVADDATARSIYKQIKTFSAIRPFDFLLTNAPGLDDTYWNWGKTEPMEGFQRFGDWVNGGAWGTVEGRAILGYYRVGAFEDVRRSAERAMKWAKEFRMDGPWSQRGENTNNSWSDSGKFQVGGVAVMIDNFAIPAATIRGLFDYEYRFDRLILRPRVPRTITEYVQKEPVRFGEKALYISCRNGGMKVKSVSVNGQSVKVESPDTVDLQYDDLPKEAKIEIVTEGGWNEVEPSPSIAPPTPIASKVAAAAKTELPESLRKPYATLKTMKRLLADEPDVTESERAFVHEAIQAIEAWRGRTAVEAQGFFRPMTPEKRDSIITFYENAALAMYRGFVKRMSGYAMSPNADEKRLAELFQEASR